MKHFYTDAQIFDAYKAAQEQAHPWTSMTSILRAFLDELPEPEDDLLIGMRQQIGRLQDLTSDDNEAHKWLAVLNHIVSVGMSHTQVIDSVEAMGRIFSTGKIAAEDLNFLASRNIEIPEPRSTDDWQECEPQDVRLSDQRVRVKIKSGYIAEGKPTKVTDQGALLNDAYTLFWSNVDSVYRIPTPVVHPDPKKHPTIGRVEYYDADDPDYAAVGHANGGDYMLFNNGVFQTVVTPTEILNWVPVRVIEDD